jgi:hypothetical protein
MPAKDPVQRRATVRAWYHRTKHKVDRAKRKRARQAQRKKIGDWYAELKHTLVCNRCGENHPACLQFHHSDPTTKELSIGDAIRRAWNRDRIVREIAKCEVLCANCHAKHHARDVGDD